jgi:hypothetical protein
MPSNLTTPEIVPPLVTGEPSYGNASAVRKTIPAIAAANTSFLIANPMDKKTPRPLTPLCGR